MQEDDHHEEHEEHEEECRGFLGLRRMNNVHGNLDKARDKGSPYVLFVPFVPFVPFVVHLPFLK